MTARKKGQLEEQWVYPCTKSCTCACGARVRLSRNFEMPKSAMGQREALAELKLRADYWKSRPEQCRACRESACKGDSCPAEF